MLKKWKKTTGYGIISNHANISNNIVKGYYDNDYVYLQTNSIPSYSIGPWNVPSSNYPVTPLNKRVRLTRRPQKAQTNVRSTMGPMGIFIDGVFM
jgi:hypothetical protein